ncbi:unnamed protein product [Ambrosiozyma monospora]|uniref:Unnamed protein product n=1 Tax=Ambrosiozyma monospora TaxID=43982 RepID=A0ACB5TW53_AMBMO|nr:unnamed protein product [Ambrosiozyma monospora]
MFSDEFNSVDNMADWILEYVGKEFLFYKSSLYKVWVSYRMGLLTDNVNIKKMVIQVRTPSFKVAFVNLGDIPPGSEGSIKGAIMLRGLESDVVQFDSLEAKTDLSVIADLLDKHKVNTLRLTNVKIGDTGVMSDISRIRNDYPDVNIEFHGWLYCRECLKITEDPLDNIMQYDAAGSSLNRCTSGMGASWVDVNLNDIERYDKNEPPIVWFTPNTVIRNLVLDCTFEKSLSFDLSSFESVKSFTLSSLFTSETFKKYPVGLEEFHIDNIHSTIDPISICLPANLKTLCLQRYDLLHNSRAVAATKLPWIENWMQLHNLKNLVIKGFEDDDVVAEFIASLPDCLEKLQVEDHYSLDTAPNFTSTKFLKVNKFPNLHTFHLTANTGPLLLSCLTKTVHFLQIMKQLTMMQVLSIVFVMKTIM